MTPIRQQPLVSWEGILAQAKRIQEMQNPYDIVAFYMAQTTFDVIKKLVAPGQSLRSYLGASFGLPVHIDNTMDHMVLDGVQRDGERIELYAEASHA